MVKPTYIHDDYKGLVERVLKEIGKKQMATLLIDVYSPEQVGGSGNNLSYRCRTQLTPEADIIYEFQYFAKGDHMFTKYDSRKVLHEKVEKEFKKAGLISEITDWVRYGTSASQVCKASGDGLLYVFKKEKSKK